MAGEHYDLYNLYYFYIATQVMESVYKPLKKTLSVYRCSLGHVKCIYTLVHLYIGVS